jgi:hypothetical protein
MSSARRFQLLSQAHSVRISKGEQLFPEGQAPNQVCMILTGTVWIFAEMPGEPEPIFMGELGPGDCAGWVAALAGARGVRAVAKTEVQGLLVAAPAFLEIARYDPALREEMFSRPRRGEVWRAVLAEMERRTGGITTAREIVAGLADDCVTRDWPEDEDSILTEQNRLWIVAGGEGVKSGDRWGMTDGVLWARLIGLPSDKLTKSLAGEIPKPTKETLRSRQTSAPESSLTKPDPATSSTAERAGTERLRAMAPTPIPAPAPAPGPGRAKRVRAILKTLAMTLGVAVAVGGAAAFWASHQPVTEPFATSGTLHFVGERRTVTAGVNGTLSEWGMHPGARIERGSVIAIIQPPMDEARVKVLAETATNARLQADFCEAALAGRPLRTQGQPKQLADLATELVRLRSDQRVLAAVERGATTDYTLTAEERQRVAAYFAAARAEQADRFTSNSRDVSPRRQELREAEAELHDAQVDAEVQAKAYAEIRAEKQKREEDRENKIAAQRALELVKRVVAQKQDAVNRLRKEIEEMSKVAEPESQPGQDAFAALPAIKASIAKIEEQLLAHSDTLRHEESSSNAALAKLRADFAPRQIEALQPGLVLEAAPLKVGSPVHADTILGRLTTRQDWEVECQLSVADLARFQVGQDISIVTINPDGTNTRIQERFARTGRAGERPRLAMVNSRDQWCDGLPVRIETTVVTGTLLDRWITEFRKTSAR